MLESKRPALASSPPKLDCGVAFSLPPRLNLLMLLLRVTS
jgi:hypothetical protein